MAILDVPPEGLSVGGPRPQVNNAVQATPGSALRSAVILRLDEQLVQSLRDCAHNKLTVQLQCGQTPRIQHGEVTTVLSTRDGKHVQDLYASIPGGELQYLASVKAHAVITHSTLQVECNKESDLAIDILKQSLASHAEEKASKQTTISSSIITDGRHKGSRLTPGRHIISTSRSHTNSPLLSPSKARIEDASCEVVELRAMTLVLTHLLAIEPLTETEVGLKTGIPSNRRLGSLQKVADYDTGSKDWRLKDRAYKDLDVFKFGYPSDEVRQTVIDNATRAYDRIRLGKDDKLWQLLLPHSERGKGKCLSRLHGANRQLKQPNVANQTGRSTPNPTFEVEKDGQSRISNAERPVKSQGNHSSTSPGCDDKVKTTESDSSKIEQEMRKKSETVVKVKTSVNKHKSEDKVFDSDEEHSGEQKIKTKVPKEDSQRGTSKDVMVKKVATLAKPSLRGGTAKGVIESGTSDIKSKPAPKHNLPANADIPQRLDEKSPESKTVSKKSSRQLSPPKVNSKPRVPSPLGNTLTKSPSLFGGFDSSTPVVKRVLVTSKPTSSISPKSIEKTINNELLNVSKKRPLERADEKSEPPRKLARTQSSSSINKVSASTTATKQNTRSSQAIRNSDATLKRKANDISSDIHQHGSIDPTVAHRRTGSSSTQSVALSSSSLTSSATTATTSLMSPSPPPCNSFARDGWARSPSNESFKSDSLRSSWERALDDAEKFRNEYYPAYQKLYNKIAGMKAGEASRDELDELFRMHERLKSMKRDIKVIAVGEQNYSY